MLEGATRTEARMMRREAGGDRGRILGGGRGGVGGVRGGRDGSGGRGEAERCGGEPRAHPGGGAGGVRGGGRGRDEHAPYRPGGRGRGGGAVPASRARRGVGLGAA